MTLKAVPRIGWNVPASKNLIKLKQRVGGARNKLTQRTNEITTKEQPLNDLTQSPRKPVSVSVGSNGKLQKTFSMPVQISVVQLLAASAFGSAQRGRAAPPRWASN